MSEQDCIGSFNRKMVHRQPSRKELLAWRNFSPLTAVWDSLYSPFLD
jgi:hypothetical protein